MIATTKSFPSYLPLLTLAASRSDSAQLPPTLSFRNALPKLPLKLRRALLFLRSGCSGERFGEIVERPCAL